VWVGGRGGQTSIAGTKTRDARVALGSGIMAHERRVLYFPWAFVQLIATQVRVSVTTHHHHEGEAAPAETS